MTSSRLLVLSTFLLLVPRVAFAQRSATDIESARRAYNEGLELRDKGDLLGALDKFKAAHALGNTPITGTELCKTHAAVNQPVEAREVCLGVGRLPVQSGESANATNARSDASRIAEEMKAKISVVRLRLTGVPQGREPTVTVDGFAVPAAALGEPRALDPGQHVVTAKVGRGQETKALFETREGEKRDVDIAVTPPPVDEEPPMTKPGEGPAPVPAKKGSNLATGMFITAGIAGGVGIIGGIAALSGKGDLDEKCTDKICGKDDHDTLSRARTWGTVSTVFFIGAGAALTVGLIALATGSSSKAAAAPKRIVPVIGLGSAGIHGTF